MILSDAKTRVAKLADDAGADRFDTTELADALKSAQGEAWTVALSGPRKFFKLTAAVSSSSAGVVDLSALKPRKLLSLSYVQSSTRLLVLPARYEEAPANHAQVATLSVLYIPDVDFPANDAAAFVWASASAMPSLVAQLESLMIALAVLELKPKSNERLAGLQERVDQMKKSVEDAIPSSSWSTIPLDGMTANRRRHAPFRYIETGPHSLQLVTTW